MSTGNTKIKGQIRQINPVSQWVSNVIVTASACLKGNMGQHSKNEMLHIRLTNIYSASTMDMTLCPPGK